MKLNQYKEIKTDRLILNRFTQYDIKNVFAMASDTDVVSKCLMPFPYQENDAEKWINNQTELIEKNKDYTWAIRLKENNKLIGAIGLMFDKDNNNAEVGYWLGKEFHNQQYGREALQEVVEYAFNCLELNKLWANIFTNNYPSITIIEWCGFQPEGKMRGHKFHKYDGKYKDVLIYGVINSEYQKRKF